MQAKKRLRVWGAALVLGLSGMAVSASASEPWKGIPPDHDMTVGALVGMSISGTHADMALLGTLAKRIVDHGFVPDLKNQVFLELTLGPDLLATDDTTGFLYSVHLRWDLHYSDELAVFAIGGLGGTVVKDALDGNTASVHPRFGVGALYKFSEVFALRGELSSELIAAGVHFSI